MSATLLLADWVVPITADVIENGAVVVDDDGVIVAVGTADGVIKAFPSMPQRRINGALMPALVNAHTHVELSALRGLVPGGQGLVTWVQALMPLSRGLATEQKLQGMRLAIEELWTCGTAAIGDVANRLDAATALAASPLQGTFFHELLGSYDVATGDALLAGRKEHDVMAASGTWPVRFAYVQAPHAPYSASPALLQRIFSAANARNERTTIHVAEDPDELALLLRGEGSWPGILAGMGVPLGQRTPKQNPVAYLAALGAFGGTKPPLMVHMTCAAAADVDLAALAKAPVVLCPRSNIHVGGRLPDVPALIKAGAHLALGTDSLASNASLSLWEEMATLHEHFGSIDPVHWLRAATHGGALALDRPHLGSIAPGKKPGLLAIDVQSATDLLVPALTRTAPSNIHWVVAP